MSRNKDKSSKRSKESSKESSKAKEKIHALRSNTIPDPAKSALLIIDMQEYFTDIAKPIAKNINSLAQNLKELGTKVIFTRHGHRAPEKDAGMLYEWWGDHIIESTPKHALLPEMQTTLADKIIPKKRYSAFHETKLDGYLKGNKITDLIICGVMTNLCCETTARDAFVHDYRVYFMSDATASYDTSLHEASLKNLKEGFAYILATHPLLSALGNQA